MASSTTNITMRLENALVECIDKSAERAGLTRSAYTSAGSQTPTMGEIA